MNIDFSDYHENSILLLEKWRERYSKVEYPYKVVVNIFYRQFAMKQIWNKELDNSFVLLKKSESDLYISVDKLHVKYNESANTLLVNNRLADLMEIHKNLPIGNLKYSHFIELINKAQHGDNNSTEEIEYSYIFYRLLNEYIIYWAGFGRIGYGRISAFEEITGCSLDEKKSYPVFTFDTLSNMITPILGFYAKKIYQPLSPFWKSSD